MTVAITRHLSPRFEQCERTHIDCMPIDLEVARAQHREYVRILVELGCRLIELPAEPGLPDSVFVEDTAVVLPEAAVVARPGADSRKPETLSICRALAPYRQLLHITAPATLDGGDVLVMGKVVYVGLSTRSNREAVAQLDELLSAFGYGVMGVELRDCLHLKSAVTRVDDNTVLINPVWVDAEPFRRFEWIEVDPREPHGANCLPLGGRVIYPTAFPHTRIRLERRGYRIAAVALDELAKAEGAVTCCSLIV
jgi:dimethylargininase